MLALTAALLLAIGTPDATPASGSSAAPWRPATAAVAPRASVSDSWAKACSTTGRDRCDFEDRWDCSVPVHAEYLFNQLTGGVGSATHAYYKELFSRACVRHDGCYRHGRATYKLSKSQCDSMFLDDMKARCESLDAGSLSVWLSLGMSKAACMPVARAYYTAVDKHSGDAYRDGDRSTVCYYDRATENAHVHLIGKDGRFGSVDHRYMWTSGWWVASRVATASDDRLLLLKPGNGSVHVHRPTASGRVGTRIGDYDWSSAWTHARGYAVGDQRFLFLLKTSTGEAQVRRLTTDGTVGEKVKEYDWSKGWTSVEFYQAGGETYLMLLKGEDLRLDYILRGLGLDAPAGSGLVHIHRMNADGTVGQRVHRYDWSSGWSIARPFTIGAKPYLLLLKSDNGVVHVHPINDDGSIGPRVDDANWSSGWTVAEPYEIDGKSFVFLMKSGNGTAKIRRINDDGTIGSEVQQYDWRDGWTSATFYRVDGRLFALLLKAVEGGKN